MGGGLESRCIGRVYGADGAVRLALDIRELSWSNFAQGTKYLTEWLSGFPQALQANVEIEF